METLNSQTESIHPGFNYLSQNALGCFHRIAFHGDFHIVGSMGKPTVGSLQNAANILGFPQRWCASSQKDRSQFSMCPGRSPPFSVSQYCVGVFGLRNVRRNIGIEVAIIASGNAIGEVNIKCTGRHSVMALSEKGALVTTTSR